MTEPIATHLADGLAKFDASAPPTHSPDSSPDRTILRSTPRLNQFGGGLRLGALVTAYDKCRAPYSTHLIVVLRKGWNADSSLQRSFR
jgi:hypothetical protein